MLSSTKRNRKHLGRFLQRCGGRFAHSQRSGTATSHPFTPPGKGLASIITIIGIGMVALPTSLFASGFAYVMNRNEQMLKDRALEALSDGVVTTEEAFSYEKLAESLYIEPEMAFEIIQAMAKKRPIEDLDDCPHCGKSLCP